MEIDVRKNDRYVSVEISLDTATHDLGLHDDEEMLELIRVFNGAISDLLDCIEVNRHLRINKKDNNHER